MCGRVIQSSEPLRLAIVDGLDLTDRRMSNLGPRYNAAPSQELRVIRQKTSERSLDLIKWGLIPNWCPRPYRWAEANQCEGGERLKVAYVPGGLCLPALHRAG
jgi:putative SOS response-associated peptidase YedK